MNAIIIDDESGARLVLRSILEGVGEVDIVGEADSVATGVDLCKSATPEVAFVDVRMADGDGFEIAQQCLSLGIRFVFVTAYDEFAIQAIRACAVDYLLKPVSEREVRDALDRCRNRQDGDQAAVARRIEAVLRAMSTSAAPPPRLAVPTAEGFRMVDVADIVRCEAQSNYTTLHLASRERLLVSRTLREIADMLPSQRFLRCHQSHIVAVDRIERYVRGKGGYLVLTDGTSVDVSVRKKDDVVAALTGRPS